MSYSGRANPRLESRGTRHAQKILLLTWPSGFDSDERAASERLETTQFC